MSSKSDKTTLWRLFVFLLLSFAPPLQFCSNEQGKVYVCNYTAAKASVLILCETCEIPKFGLQSVCKFMIIHSRDGAAGRSPGGTERLTSTRALRLSNKTKMQNPNVKHSETNHFIRHYTKKFQTQFYSQHNHRRVSSPFSLMTQFDLWKLFRFEPNCSSLGLASKKKPTTLTDLYLNIRPTRQNICPFVSSRLWTTLPFFLPRSTKASLKISVWTRGPSLCESR